MVSRVTHDESRRLEILMAEFRDLPRSAAFKALPIEDQKRMASVLRDLATKIRAPKPESVSGVSQKAEFGALVEQVDFPNFVGALIKDTFNAIVDSSIQQMEAYGKLVSEVATSIEDQCKPGC
jgi:hypothetical protein